ncbi:MAG: hypothetical protein ACRD19_16910 [Terriglobia bacterium]
MPASGVEQQEARQQIAANVDEVLAAWRGRENSFAPP